jgi:ABC-type Mn2+/Zn2+ transport system permease subunit
MIALYGWTIPAGAVFAGALALLGCQLAARDRAMQTVCVSQGAMLGVLIALSMGDAAVHEDPEGHLFPFFVAATFSALTFLATNWLADRKHVSKNTLFASIFAVLLASGYLVSALFPGLESHMSQIYFGDLATITEFDAKVTLVLGALALLGLAFSRRQLTLRSFESTVFGAEYTVTSGRRWALLFNVVAVALLCFSVQFLGFLFTIAVLFVPTTVLSLGRARGLDRHLFSSCAVAMIGTGAGFLLSLRFTRLPTVPMVALTLLASSILLAVVGGRISLRRED